MMFFGQLDMLGQDAHLITNVMPQNLRLAIVEDNASARTHLRSHLIALGNLEIFSFSNGKELKAALRTQSVDIVVSDFHLGQNKNGVDWIKNLQKAELLKPSTGIIFITSDQTAQTIGQILDIQPDFLLVKPYTMRTIKKVITQYLNIRSLTTGVLNALDTNEPTNALTQLDKVIKKPAAKRYSMHLLKLRARILMLMKDYARAMALYESVLQRSSSVIWARWGKIRCLFMQGDWDKCQQAISDLLDLQLTQNKAYEWLACIAFEEKNFARAEQWLDHIKMSELTLQATRLKTLTYQMQQRVDDAIELLERKRISQMSVREQRDELTFELADCHMRHALSSKDQEREESLHKARRLIGAAGRNTTDRQAQQRRDYMLSFAHVLEGDTEKAQRLLESDWMHDFSRSEISTMMIAAQVWFGVGDEERSKQILELCALKSASLDDQIEHVMVETQRIQSEKAIGLAEQSAITHNQKGTEAFVADLNETALEHFFAAHKLAEDIPAFAINLLQSMLREHRSNYRGIHALALLDAIQRQPLSATNRQRIDELSDIIHADYQHYLMPHSTTATDVASEVVTATESITH
ncbi:response regulator [Alteromonas flava]|uniref:response regulator n=1 Tax=Alteromonas flava TaxID=2048003 RepID=UPI000C292C45|nr:response regulator [Alteromonas flava]